MTTKTTQEIYDVLMTMQCGDFDRLLDMVIEMNAHIDELERRDRVDSQDSPDLNKKTMSPSRRIAEEFIRDQVRIMGEHGKAPKLSAKRYQEAVAETERSFESLRKAHGRKTYET